MGIQSFKTLTADNFQHEIKDGVTLVDFYADWCGPCRMLTPILENVAKEMGDVVTIAKVDIVSEQETAAELHVTAFPTLILYRAGKEAGRLVGLRDAETIKKFVLS